MAVHVPTAAAARAWVGRRRVASSGVRIHAMRARLQGGVAIAVDHATLEPRVLSSVVDVAGRRDVAVFRVAQGLPYGELTYVGGSAEPTVAARCAMAT